MNLLENFYQVFLMKSPWADYFLQIFYRIHILHHKKISIFYLRELLLLDHVHYKLLKQMIKKAIRTAIVNRLRKISLILKWIELAFLPTAIYTTY